MGIDSTLRLHWTQRIALVRHNLHAARRANDFTFFKTLQAHAVIDGTDHVAILHSVLGNDADSVLSTLDNLNAGIAYVHQDAFKAVYDGAKSTMYKADNSPSSRRSLLRVDICQQRDMADHAIDKTANSAVQLIHAQPVHCQDAVANAWITGTTIIADAVCVCLNQMEAIEDNLDDFIRLEYSWNSIQSSVDAAISALRGIFSLMERSNLSTSNSSRNLSISSAGSAETGGSGFRSRQSSTASAFGGLIKRAFTHSQNMGPPPVAAPKHGRTNSLSVPDANPRGLRLSISAACPTKMSTYTDHPHTFLTTIPPTPIVHDAHDTPKGTANASPFRPKGDYFAFDMEKEADKKSKESSPSPSDLMQM
ncbi:uncharacterized protein N0V89_010549 [Didymosphaeria variabile]|uniref:Uncharacterized protein n=1 Tax=Didymosphaeria variabile TaxID=1932322 RepID=A0A9W8XC01_9PLEO|nr:uncharacterized protein N0V89_010549 [Didymosphaeria variabile]KAJ4346618.1 hypothetical protein N0V89_010549 [Didymosphaeria variabile]